MSGFGRGLGGRGQALLDALQQPVRKPGSSADTSPHHDQETAKVGGIVLGAEGVALDLVPVFTGRPTPYIASQLSRVWHLNDMVASEIPLENLVILELGEK